MSASAYLDLVKSMQKTFDAPAAPAAVAAPQTIEPTFFESIALPLVARLDTPVAPCYPWYYTDGKDNDGKTVNGRLVPSPLTMRSKDPAQIIAWGRAEKDGNVCVYAVQEEDGLCFVDKDGAISLRAKYEKETGKTFPKTLLVRSSAVPDGNGGTITKGHWYFRQTPRTMQAKNISESKTGGLFSFRVNNMYVASIGSVHPKTKKPYEVAEDYPVLEMPDDFLDWLQAQVVSEPKTREEMEHRGKYGLGTRYTALMSELGRLWNRGYDRAGLVAAGVAWARVNFDTGAAEFDEAMVTREIEHYVDTYGDGEDKSLILNNQTPSASVPTQEQTAQPSATTSAPTFHTVPYPEFPDWVMEGTSIYEGFVKPYCEANERIPFFMWVPCASLFLNYLGTKVRVAYKSWKPSMYIVLIGEKDKAHKSSSIKDGMKFLEYAGVLSHYSPHIKNADGKSIVWEVGSPEGLGTDMMRINCKNAVLFYDELSSLVSKSQIEGSGMMGALLKMYESNKFSNSVKTKKDAFSIEPDSYVTTLITATTDQRFSELWAQFAGEDTGLDSRFTFVLQPQQLPKQKLEKVVPIQEAALVTEKRANAAITQGVFEFNYGFDGEEMLMDCQKRCGGRAEIRAEKWSFYFCVDLGRKTIDEDCIARGVAMAQYERDVKKYLATEEAATKSAGLQQQMVRLLERNNGRLVEYGAKGFRALTGERKYGTDMWRKAFFGLVGEGVLKKDGNDVVLERAWGGKHE